MLKKTKLNPKTHITQLRPDKFLGDEYFRHLFIGHEKIGASEHEFREVKYFPEEIFCSEDDSGEKLFFISIEIVHGVPEKGTQETDLGEASKKNHLPVPIFMLDIKKSRIEEIKKIAKTKGIIISEKYFRKPVIAMCYDERLNHGLEMDDETIESVEIRTTFSKKTIRKSPYDKSSFNHLH